MRLVLGAVVAAALLPAAALGEVLYATSVRSSGSEISGSLYLVDPATAVARVVGPIRIGATSVGIVAVASHPATGIFYGITGGPATVIPRSLVTIDLTTGNAQLVGPLGAPGSDIGFAPDGTLYMWLPEMSRVARVDLETGATTPLGPSGIMGAEGGGLAIDDTGETALVAVTGATGTLDSVDLKTGIAVRGPSLTRAPHGDSIENLTFGSSGTLYAVNSNAGTPASAALVTIDTVTGVVYKIGTLPDDVHGLIFRKDDSRLQISARDWSLIGLGIAALLLILFAVFSGNRPE